MQASNSTVTFAAYPYERFLQTRRDAEHNVTFTALDRNAYDRAVSRLGLATKTVRAVVLENEYLGLTFLPDLGGRLFQITYKPTNQNLLYNNRVLKPSNWGPSNQGGWLAAGGMEWALPVNEHGYEWGMPWQYALTQNTSGATITLRDTTAADRVRAVIGVTLPAHAAYIVVQPRVENPTGAPVRLQFWINAQLTLGAGKNVSPNTDFILPTDSVFVHSTGDTFIPDANIPPDGAEGASAPVAWSQVGGRDLSRYANWEDYLGVFAAHLTQSFAGAYNHDAELGVARVFPPQAAPGVKLFAFGPRFCCRDQFADDDSDYFELWGGLPRTFFPNDDVALAPGETRTWTEYWLPFAQTGGLSIATREAVLFVAGDSGTARVGAYYAAGAFDGTLLILSDGTEVKRWSVHLSPDRPFHTTTPVDAGRLQLRLLTSNGSIIAETQ